MYKCSRKVASSLVGACPLSRLYGENLIKEKFEPIKKPSINKI